LPASNKARDDDDDDDPDFTGNRASRGITATAELLVVQFIGITTDNGNQTVFKKASRLRHTYMHKLIFNIKQ